MPSYSPGIMFVWQLAAKEAIAWGHDLMDREHVFLALAAMEREVAARSQSKQPWDDRAAITAESLLLAEFFRAQSVNLAKAEDKLRGLMARGASTAADPNAVGRSEKCKETFFRALGLAADGRVPDCLHLTLALLEKPGVPVVRSLAWAGSDLERLQAAAWQASSARPLVTAQPAASAPAGVLESFGVDLTALAQEGKLEPLVGRHKELIQLLRTLSRKTKSNPLLLGEAGVGKTALVHALALRIATGQVPDVLKGRRIVEIAMARLMGGTKYRGELEERLAQMLDEVRRRPEVILFIDEIHTVVSAGRAEGGLDIANMLKPALAGPDFHCIGATTVSEYRNHFEKDPALSRRFQPVHVDAPSAADTIAILEGLRPRYEEHHGIRIDASAIRAAVELSCRYILNRQLPDKALDLLDESCTRVKFASTSFTLNAGGRPELGPVTAEVVAQVIADWTGIPLARLSAEGQQRLQNMAGTLAKRVIGQPEAIEKLTRVVTMSRAGLHDPRRPVGVFLFVGPTGVGKTELCRALAEFLFGSEDDLFRIDMSEFAEKHAMSRLIGSPPGYVGHEEEGQLTGRLMRKPYSVVLFDEIEKAHPDVFDLFLQLFDDGRLTDSRGRTADGRHAIYVMTSNLVFESSGSVPLGFAPTGAPPVPRDAREPLMRDLRRTFRAEFLNRIDEVVPFRSLSLDDVATIARQGLNRVAQALLAQGIEIEFAASAVEFLARAGYDPANGARPLARAIDRLVSGPLSAKIVAGEIQPGDRIAMEPDGSALRFLNATRPEAGPPA